MKPCVQGGARTIRKTSPNRHRILASRERALSADVWSAAGTLVKEKEQGDEVYEADVIKDSRTCKGRLWPLADWNLMTCLVHLAAHVGC